VLSVPTLWVVFVVNFVALGLVWTYVSRSYPNFEASRFWTVAAFMASVGAAISMLRTVTDPILPVVIGGSLLIAACSFCAFGIERFYGRPLSWRRHAILIAVGVVSISYFSIVHPSTNMRIVFYSCVQALVIAQTLPLTLTSHNRRAQPGAWLAGLLAAMIICVNVARSVMATFHIGGFTSMIDFNPVQAAMVLLLLFLGTMWNFGFLMMAIDRLRGEVAALALLDDLTGVANRRQFLIRLHEECVRSHRSLEPFSILAIDLDGFKDINDSHGHGAGDECLRVFASAVQERLRASDLLARMGGDEFFVVLPSTTAPEAALVAEQLLDACAARPVHWNSAELSIGISIGIAQWSHAACATPEQLVAAADQALYTAKKQGKSCFAMADETLPDDGPGVTPSPPTAPLLKTA
jgi:diguanylate cyclase (GGDEF)-like protein